MIYMNPFNVNAWKKMSYLFILLHSCKFYIIFALKLTIKLSYIPKNYYTLISLISKIMVKVISVFNDISSLN